MKLKYLLIGLLALLVLVPTYLYVVSVDWSKKHAQKIAILPLFKQNMADGQYRLAVNKNEFVIRIWGANNTGGNLMLLHGFPESSLMWESFGQKAAQAGYRVLAFDQRGYSPNARPNNVADYDINLLANDVLEVADQLGFGQFNLVGHDWGAMVGWQVVMNKPDRIQTWTALSIPHPASFFEAVVNDTVQQKKSTYINLFKQPILPEFLLTYRHQSAMKGILAKLPSNQVTEYLDIMAEPGAMTALLNWYRALDINTAVKNKVFDKNISVPTLFIWGVNDGAVSAGSIPGQRKYMTGRYQMIELPTGHNLVQAEEKTVLEAVLKHIKTTSSTE
jgi:pimeloyl-ACP methyl ester carboxylesterase